MSQNDLFTILGFGPTGWGQSLLSGALMTIAIALSGFSLGAIVGTFVAWAKISGGRFTAGVADAYTTVLRGVPDLLVIYLFYFGSAAVLTPLARMLGTEGFLTMPGFLAGTLAIGLVCGAFHAEVLRGAYRAVAKGELEAALAVGMPRFLMFRRIVAPLVLRHALPGLGNVWQLVLKESALVSVIGVIELMRQAQLGSGSTRQPFTFFMAAAVLYMLISTVSSFGLRRAELRLTRGQRGQA